MIATSGGCAACWLLGLAALVGEPACNGPTAELRTALEDLRLHVPPQARSATRYLSLYNLPADQHPAAIDAIALVLNSVSRAATLHRPERVSLGEQRLLRVDWLRYELPLDAWERLVTRDPYWHLRTRVVPPGQGHAHRVQEVYTDGGWLDLHEAAQLRALSGSSGAILRGDWFLAQASTTLNGGAYYDLAGIPEREADLFRLLGLDLAVIDRLRADAGANLLDSGVTHKLRRVVRRQGPLGAIWQTYDVARSTPERDPFRNPFAFEFDAGEYIAAKSNGLHLFALYDRAGLRQDTVPDVIAKDATDRHGGGIIVPALSCLRCHVEDGLRPVENDQRRLLSSGISLFAESRAAADRLTAFYESDLDKHLRRDREDFAAAVAACTAGRTSSDAVGLLSRLVSDYVDRRVTPSIAARELGVSPDQFAALRGSFDPVLLALVAGLAVQREQWEASFAEGALLIQTNSAIHTRSEP